MPELHLGGLIDTTTGDRSTDDASSHVRVDTDKFTTHGVIVGMTGSGKTGLGVVLIEEVLRAGLPVIAIDPKGDLTNLCLTFPDLAPDDFRPWIDVAQAESAGQSAEEFAAAQAGMWSAGLGGWGLDRQRHRCAALHDRLHDLHTRFAVGRAGEHRRLVAGPRRHVRPRGGQRRGRGVRHRPARARRDRRRPVVESRAHLAVEPDHRRVEPGPIDHPDGPGGDGRQPPDPQARRVRPRPVLPARRPDEAGDAAQRTARVRRRSRRGARAHRSTSSRCCTGPTGDRDVRSSPPPTCRTRSASSSRR